MKSKFKRILGLVLSLLVVFTQGLCAFAEETPKKEPITKYHLDMGVIVVVNHNGRWVENRVLGGDYKYKASLNFPDSVKVKRILTVEEANTSGILWDVQNDSEKFTHNIPLKANILTPEKGYNKTYWKHKSSNIRNYKVLKGEGKNIKFSVDVKLKGLKENYNLIDKYIEKSYPVQIIKEIKVKDTKVADELKYTISRMAYLKKANQEIKDKYINQGKTDKEKKKIAKAKPWEKNDKKWIKNHKEYWELKERKGTLENSPQYKTVQQMYEEYKLNLEKFINEVYKFWGSKENLKNTNTSMYNMMVNMEKGNVNMKDRYYLIFVPTVIEYEESEFEDEPEDFDLDTHIDIPSGGCGDKIRWTETKNHTYKVCKSNGKKKKCKTKVCKHEYTYEATLTSLGALQSAKPNGGVTLLKSGYGFSVVLKNTVNIVQIANSGSCGESKSKGYEASVRMPQNAEVKTSWIVKNPEKKTKQGKVVALEKKNEWGYFNEFITAKNPVSHYLNRQIYTDVTLKGTKKKPVKHTVNVYTYGGGVGEKQFCKNIPLTFTINGDMYEDDFTVDRR